ncbi:LmeA family phospholipid-binding protein [Blastococcus sp. SYSU DS0617]
MRALLVVVLLLAGLGLLADRVAVGIAEDRVAEELAGTGGLVGTPEVDIAGFPFLTQVFAGRYEDVRVAFDAEELPQPEGTRASVSLQGVQVPLSAVLAGSVTEVPVDRIDGVATLSYDRLAAEIGAGTTLVPEGDGLRIERSVELLGRTLPVSAAGTVALEDDELVIDVDRARGAGVEIPAFLVDRVSDLLDLRYTVPDLPFGLQLTGVAPAADGVRVRVEATGSVLTAQ